MPTTELRYFQVAARDRPTAANAIVLSRTEGVTYNHRTKAWVHDTGWIEAMMFEDSDQAENRISEVSRAQAERAVTEFGQVLPTEAELTRLLAGPTTPVLPPAPPAV